jgi:hypothetical protein
VEDGGDQQADVAAVYAGDGVTESDGNIGGKAGRKAEHPLLSSRARQFARVEREDHGLPVDAGQLDAGFGDAGTCVDEAGEVVAAKPRRMGDNQRGSSLDRAEALRSGPQRGRQ